MFSPKVRILEASIEQQAEKGTNASTMTNVHNKPLAPSAENTKNPGSSIDDKWVKNPESHSSEQESGDRVGKVGTAVVTGMVAAKKAAANDGPENASTLGSIPTNEVK